MKIDDNSIDDLPLLTALKLKLLTVLSVTVTSAYEVVLFYMLLPLLFDPYVGA